MKRDLLVNFISKGWIALLSIIAIPLYLHYLGIEAYGLIGFFAALQGLLSLFDMGFGTTLNREYAVMTALSDQAQNMRDLLKTLQLIYITVGIGLSILIVVLSPLIVHHWIRVIDLPQKTVLTSIILMGISFLAQWPISFYTNGLMGLHYQVLANGLIFLFGTLRTLGAVLIILLFSSDITAFFKWQAFVAFLNVFIVATILWKKLPYTGKRPHFRSDLLKSVWGYSAGLTGIAITAVLWSQMDKVILSKLLTLKEFGYYMLAFSVAVAINNMSYPVYTMIFPKLAHELAKGNIDNLKKIYHTGCQVIALTLIPVALLICIFSKKVVWIWTGSYITAEETHKLISILSLCSLLGGILLVPQALQLSYKWTSLTFYSNIFATVFMSIAMIILVPRYGV